MRRLNQSEIEASLASSLRFRKAGWQFQRITMIEMELHYGLDDQSSKQVGKTYNQTLKIYQTIALLQENKQK